MVTGTKCVGDESVIFVFKATFVQQEVFTRRGVSKNTIWDGTGRTKSTGQNVVTFSALEFEFAMTISEKSANV